MTGAAAVTVISSDIGGRERQLDLGVLVEGDDDGALGGAQAGELGGDLVVAGQAGAGS